MNSLDIDIDKRAVERAMKRAPGVTKRKLNAWITRTAFMAQREGKQEVPPNVDTGELESSIQTTFGNFKATTRPTAKYAIWIHRGRKAGSRMPPFQEGSNLYRWATKRGMPPFVVARSIAAKGTKANPFMDKAYRKVKPNAERDAKRMLAEIVREI